MRHDLALLAAIAMIAAGAPLAVADPGSSGARSSSAPAAADIGAVKHGAPIAAAPDPDRRDTNSNNEATSAPGAKGPIEGGRHAPSTKRTPNVTGGGLNGGVQNPHLGSGNNGSPETE